ncbi:hypothetical protein GIB67_035111 [Kingdonia uniflora]|uniref:Myb/SANT-like domain-containing protein n=1 Tax=Kingdonia uniflora TaxID=39325 RepID=A0A7J7NW21_9MAGN|nr:hypothetical protein GIB67_035111 [Kingdonia uniflora]
MDSVTPSSSERPRTIWTPSMDRYFINLVQDQVHRGNMVDHAFRKQVWVHMTTLFNDKFGYQYDKEILKNRYKNLRRKYNEITHLLSQNGFQWDKQRQMVIADDRDWDIYIKAHPDKRPYRTKVLSYYGDLCMIYGNEPHDGRYSNDNLEIDTFGTKSGEVLEGLQSPHTPGANGDPVGDAQDSSDLGQEMIQRSAQEGAKIALCEIEAIDPLAISNGENNNDLVPVEVLFSLENVENKMNSNLNGPVKVRDNIQGMDSGRTSRFDIQENSSHLGGGGVTMCSRPIKRALASTSQCDSSKKLCSSTDKYVVDALHEMAILITSLAEKKKENSDSNSIEGAIDALQAIPNLDEELLLDACDFLEDEKKAKMFLVLDAKFRKKWLMRKLRPSNFGV